MNQGEQVPLVSRTYPIRTFKIFGGIQIGLGVVCCVLSVLGIVLDSITLSKGCNDWNYNYNYYVRCDAYWDASPLLAFDITSLIFAGWFILTGCFPFCMSDKRRNSWRCLKITFMVCCILGASIFVPTVVSLGVVGAIFRAGYSGGGLATIPGFVGLLGFVELIVSIVAASYCCCCSSWTTSTRNRTVYVTSTQPPFTVMNMPNTQIPVGSPVAYVNPGIYQSGVISQQNQGIYQTGVISQQNQGATVTNAPAPATTDFNQPPPYKQ